MHIQIVDNLISAHLSFLSQKFQLKKAFLSFSKIVIFQRMQFNENSDFCLNFDKYVCLFYYIKRLIALYLTNMPKNTHQHFKPSKNTSLARF
jgi:hypothetical protein